jgi:uncharacterized membrane protein YkvA (DUF1232 family)
VTSGAPPEDPDGAAPPSGRRLTPEAALTPDDAGDPAQEDTQGWRPTRLSQEAVALLPDLARLLRALVADPRTPRRAKVVAAVAAAYVASPVDLLPDVIPSVGGIDDLFVVLGAIRYLVSAAGYDLIRELWTGNDAGFSLLIVFTGVEH